MSGYLTEKQVRSLVCQIARLLNNVPIGQARSILTETDFFICAGHMVDINSPCFKKQLAEHEEFAASVD